jgi:pyridoxine 4-dehydrogenase
MSVVTHQRSFDFGRYLIASTMMGHGTCHFLATMKLTASITALAIAAFSPAQAFVGKSLSSTIQHHQLLSATPKHDADKDQEGAGESRRDFVQKVATGVPAAVIAASTMGLSRPEPAVAAQAVSAAAVAKSSSLVLPPMGLGAWAWGDSLFWGYDAKNDEELRKVFDYAVEQSKSKTTFFDTAELYGLGRSEKLIGEFSKKYDQDKIQVATKFAAFPPRSKPQDVVKACEKSLQRLGRPIDLYQIHFPAPWCNEEFWDGLATAYENGLVKAVGVSNYGADATRACHAALAKRGVPLASNQIQLSLLYRYPLENSLMETCEELGVQVLSYSPLALGMLTGKYTLDEPPKGPRKGLFKALKSTPDYDNLLAAMKDVASGHKDATLSQVALNWTRAKNSIPIPGARTLSQVQQNFGALDWNLSASEVKALDQAAAKVTTFSKPEDVPFPKEDRNTHLKLFDS